ncbi:hypothetical protein QJS10_CPA10g01277 [Acorus calamus]|uniref:CCHC-type domain-containing protein n=1 Tax=Acorus calamus TaxID=4465 RepID=A0AAV9E0K2_ACOCL|nr:hypothetical protein QJS10_CPA10g01277 [Acorus calamus]
MASSATAHYLKAVTGQAWSRSQFGTGAKCNYVTNNISESFNALRGLSILKMVDMIRHKMMERMDHRRSLGRKWMGKLVPKAFKYVQNLVKDIRGQSYAYEWVKINLPFSVSPPKTVKPRGRPRKNRIKHPDEKRKRRHMCMRCKEIGHHKSSCKNPIRYSQMSEGSGRGRGGRNGRGRGRVGRVSTIFSNMGGAGPSDESSMGGF